MGTICSGAFGGRIFASGRSRISSCREDVEERGEGAVALDAVAGAMTRAAVRDRSLEVPQLTIVRSPAFWACGVISEHQLVE